MINASELRAGVVYEDQGQFLLVLSYEHIKMGRGSGTIKVKVKNLEGGATIEKTFNTGARVQEADLSRKKVQFLYKDDAGVHAMDIQIYEQFTLENKLARDVARYLKEGMEITLLLVGEKPVGVEIAKIAEYRIIQTGGSAKGNTSGAAQKDAVLENGLVVKVPLFIKTEEVIRVDTRSGQYVERAKS